MYGRMDALLGYVHCMCMCHECFMNSHLLVMHCVYVCTLVCMCMCMCMPLCVHAYVYVHVHVWRFN